MRPINSLWIALALAVLLQGAATYVVYVIVSHADEKQDAAKKLACQKAGFSYINGDCINLGDFK